MFYRDELKSVRKIGLLIINRKAFHEEPKKVTKISELGVYEIVFYMAEWRVTLLTEAGVSPSKEGLEPLHIYLFRNEP